MIQTILSLVFPFIAVTIFYTVVLFIGGDLFPTKLSSFYQAVPNWWLRMLIVIIPFTGTGELMLRYAYNKPDIAIPAILTAGIIIPTAVGLLLKQKLPNLEVLIIVGLICVLALYLNRVLNTL